MFDSRFIDYGFDKMSYIEKLRQMNFQMYIFNRAFAIDYPHPMYMFELFYYIDLLLENRIYAIFIQWRVYTTKFLRN